MVGMLATSKAGHDCREVYVIVREEEEYVYLADGKVRSLDKPKKKNKKHIQPIKKIRNEELAERLATQQPVRDEEIKRMITLYKAEREG